MCVRQIKKKKIYQVPKNVFRSCEISMRVHWFSFIYIYLFFPFCQPWSMLALFLVHLFSIGSSFQGVLSAGWTTSVLLVTKKYVRKRGKKIISIDIESRVYGRIFFFFLLVLFWLFSQCDHQRILLTNGVHVSVCEHTPLCCWDRCDICG